MNQRLQESVKKRKLRERLDQCSKYFSGEKYATLLSLSSMFLEQNNLVMCEETLDKLPTMEKLLETLITKLKGKSVYKTLKKLHEGKEQDPLLALKGVSSLITHCCIELEHGQKEFGILLPSLLEKQSQLIFDL
jgi:hypothetical protein